MWCAEEIHEFSILTCTSMYSDSQNMWVLSAKTLLQESILICFCFVLFCFVFARTARIFLIITTVHSFILSYLDIWMYLESAAQTCWPFKIHIFWYHWLLVHHLQFLFQILGVLSMFSIYAMMILFNATFSSKR